MKILIVDDEPLLREMLSLELQLEGHDTLEAGSASEAIKVLDTHGPHLSFVLCDVVMPGGSGKIVLEHVIKNYPGVLFVFISGYAELTEQDATELGATAFIKKPFDPATLNQTLESLSRSRKPN